VSANPKHRKLHPGDLTWSDGSVDRDPDGRSPQARDSHMAAKTTVFLHPQYM
jgi:hypothetical protein